MIKKVLKAYKQVRQIFFVDDDFFILRQRGIDFCNLIIEEKKKGIIPKYLKFICLTNINRIDEENIKVIAKAGFRVLSIGVESTSQDVLDSYNKKQTPRLIYKVTNLIIKHKIKPYYTMILFSPMGKVKDLLIDLQGFRKLGEMGAGLSVEPYLIPLPGTPYWEEAIPQSSRMVTIEGTKVRMNKGFAWYPIDKKAKRIFDTYEQWFPKYKKYRYEQDGVKHKEKNYQAGIILDALEIVLKTQYSVRFKGKFRMSAKLKKLYEDVDKLEPLNVDIVGDFTH